MKIAYEVRDFKPTSLAVIDQANAIIDEYEAAGYTLTLRQLYYQFVARDLLRNRQTEYKRLGAIINDGRLAGLIDWTAIEDRTRNIRGGGYTNNAESVIRSTPDMVSVDPWRDQAHYVEVWIEKDALLGVIEGVCSQLRVRYFSCRGYTSQSEVWRAAMRHCEQMQKGRDVTILHLGDHDPSGIDMTRDITDRLGMFCSAEGLDSPTVMRLALNMSQVDEYGPPPNPAKLTDSRSTGYISVHGAESWELDALEPQVLADLVRENVERFVDRDAWNAAIEWRDAERARLQAIVDQWESTS